MGSDLSMSPPTPDEFRIVRAGSVTAVYYRHTDGIYQGGTRTWHRKHWIEDETEAALTTLKATHPGWKVTTLADGNGWPETLPYEALATSDREWEAEERELSDRVARARQKATLAYEEAIGHEAVLLRLREEREAAGA